MRNPLVREEEDEPVGERLDVDLWTCLGRVLDVSWTWPRRGSMSASGGEVGRPGEKRRRAPCVGSYKKDREKGPRKVREGSVTVAKREAKLRLCGRIQVVDGGGAPPVAPRARAARAHVV